jgi:hypothetical protein
MTRGDQGRAMMGKGHPVMAGLDRAIHDRVPHHV